MQGNHQQVSAGGAFIAFLSLLNAIVLEQGLVTHEKWYWALSITLPLLLLAVISVRKAS